MVQNSGEESLPERKYKKNYERSNFTRFEIRIITGKNILN